MAIDWEELQSCKCGSDRGEYCSLAEAWESDKDELIRLARIGQRVDGRDSVCEECYIEGAGDGKKEMHEIAAQLAEALREHGQHGLGCEAGMWQRGETHPNGYRTMYAGKWYYGDDKPKCGCGLDESLEAWEMVR